MPQEKRQPWTSADYQKVKIQELADRVERGGGTVLKTATFRRIRKMGYNRQVSWVEPLRNLDRRRKFSIGPTGVLASGPRSCFLMKGKCACHSGFKIQGEDWLGEEPKLLEVQCEVSTVSHDLGCEIQHWCW